MSRRLALLAALALLVAGCSGGSGQASGGDRGTSFVSGGGAVTLVPASRRAEPVALSGTTLSGEALDVATLRGSPVVVNVWGSWCGPCVAEAPALRKAAQALAPRKVPFVGINIRDNAAAAQAFERAYAIGYPSLVDDGQLLVALRGAVPPNAIPSTLVLDAQGRIAARVSGPVTEATLVGLVDDVAAGSAS